MYYFWAMTAQELFYRLALKNADLVGDITAKKLMAHFGSAQEVFKKTSKHWVKIDGVGQKLISSLSDKSIFEKAEKEIHYLDENPDIKTFTFDEADYPEKLKHCIDGPVLLFAKGNIRLQHQKIISIVGTRQITTYGMEFCEKLIEEIAPFNPVIVSGLAYGVDIQAHKNALKNKLQTVACLAHGLTQIYPKTHQKYVADICQNGGLVTDFISSESPEKDNFLKRNRIIAGLSEGTIVVESAEKGGSLVTAEMAHAYNREVFAVPGKAFDKYSKGCNRLIQTEKARLLTSGADLAYWLNWDLPEINAPKPVQKQIFVELSPDAQTLYDYLNKEGQQPIDLIALSCQLPTHKVATLLLNLELQGLVRPLPGKLFEAV